MMAFTRSGTPSSSKVMVSCTRSAYLPERACLSASTALMKEPEGKHSSRPQVRSGSQGNGPHSASEKPMISTMSGSPMLPDYWVDPCKKGIKSSIGSKKRYSPCEPVRPNVLQERPEITGESWDAGAPQRAIGRDGMESGMNRKSSLPWFSDSIRSLDPLIPAPPPFIAEDPPGPSITREIDLIITRVMEVQRRGCSELCPCSGARRAERGRSGVT